MIHPYNRHVAKQHLKYMWMSGIGLGGLVYFAINSEAMAIEAVWVNVVMITGIVGMAYAYHFFAYADIMYQWGIRKRIRQAVRPEVD